MATLASEDALPLLKTISMLMSDIATLACIRADAEEIRERTSTLQACTQAFAKTADSSDYVMIVLMEQLCIRVLDLASTYRPEADSEAAGDLNDLGTAVSLDLQERFGFPRMPLPAER